LTDVLRKVTHTIETHELFVPGDSMVVGVSGGPDSLCLLHVLLRLREVYRVQLHVAHLNHGARGAAADADAEFVTSIAAEWELPITVEKQDVPALAEEHKLAFEEAARRVRYGFLARVAQEIGGRKIAVGHNADDQAETVLMHFLRGTGLAGLRGMLPVTPITDYRLSVVSSQYPVASTEIVRPLLEISRAAIEAYCAEQGLSPRFDRSNLDTTFFRNRLRHELLPLLETYNPNIRDRLRHTAAVAAADYELLVQLRERAWAETVREEREEAHRSSAVVFDRAAWRALPVALQRATLRQATYRLRKTLRDVTFVHVENARQIGLQGETGAQATLPMGLALVVGHDTLAVGDAGDTGPPPDEPLLWSAEPLPVQMPGATPLPKSEWTLQVETRRKEQWDAAQIEANPDPWTAYLDADALVDPLVLRTRRRGERFRPQGMEGHRVKVSAFMTNLKLPQAWRDHVPLLVAGDEIAWVCGRRIGEKFTVGGETRRVARLQFIRAFIS
jgi:tRNA(Ile)-lysidine synthase